MTKRKKKNKKQIAQQRKQEQKKEYFKRLKHVFYSVYSEETIEILEASELHTTFNLFYIIKYPSLKITYSEDSNISGELKKHIERSLKSLLNVAVSKIQNTGKELSLRDYFSIAIHLPTYASIMISNSGSGFVEFVKESLKILLPETSSLFYGKMNFLLDYHMGFFNDFGEELYWYEFVTKKKDKNKEEDPSRVNSKRQIDLYEIEKFRDSISTEIVIRSAKPKQINVLIKDIFRPVKQFGITNAKDGLVWLKIKSGLVGSSSAFSDIPLEVYIQSHAIDRFKERIDTNDYMWIREGLKESFDQPKIIKDEYSNQYIEYHIRELNVGYFLFDLIEGKIILRTFLFLTNNGTPEGKNLQELIGIQKLDKQFLNIDKLSTFKNNDFSKNNEIKKILTDSGCKSLLDVYHELMPNKTDENNDLVGKFHQYIEKNPL